MELMKNIPVKFVDINSSLPFSWSRPKQGMSIFKIGMIQAGYIQTHFGNIWRCHCMFSKDWDDARTAEEAQKKVEKMAIKFFDRLTLIPPHLRTK